MNVTTNITTSDTNSVRNFIRRFADNFGCGPICAGTFTISSILTEYKTEERNFIIDWINQSRLKIGMEKFRYHPVNFINSAKEGQWDNSQKNFI